MELEESEKRLNQQEIVDFEESYNLSLPEDYKGFLLDNNGGYPAQELYFKNHPIDGFLSMKYGDNNIEKNIGLLEGVLDSNNIPVAESLGGIIYLDIESNRVYLKYSDDQTELLADSFKTFISVLKDSEE